MPWLPFLEELKLLRDFCRTPTEVTGIAWNTPAPRQLIEQLLVLEAARNCRRWAAIRHTCTTGKDEEDSPKVQPNSWRCVSLCYNQPRKSPTDLCAQARAKIMETLKLRRTSTHWRSQGQTSRSSLSSLGEQFFRAHWLSPDCPSTAPQFNTSCHRAPGCILFPLTGRGTWTSASLLVCKLFRGRILLFLTLGSSWQKLFQVCVLQSRSTMLVLQQKSGVICL